MSGEEAFFDFEDERGLSEETKIGIGAYHMVVQDVEEHGGHDNNQLVFDFVVLSPGPFEGMVYKEYVPQSHEDWARKKRYKIAIVLGMTTLQDLRKGGVILNWPQAVGRECVVELINDSFTDKKGIRRSKAKAKWPENFYSTNNAAAIASLGVEMAGDTKKKDEGKVSSGTKPAAPPSDSSDDDDVPF